MDLRSALKAVRSLWWVVALGAVLGGLAAGAFSFATTPRYTTDMQFFVSTSDSVSTSDVFAGSQFARERVASYSRLLEGDALAEGVISRLGLDLGPDELQNAIEASPVPETVLIDVSVSDTSAVRAQRIAEALADDFITLVGQLETPASGSESSVRVTLTETPRVPNGPSEPRFAFNVVLGIAIGLALGIALAVARDLLDRSVKSVEVATELSDAPVVGIVAKDRALAQRHVADWRESGNVTAESFRRIRNNLQFLNVDEPPRVIMVSSAVPSEGKTTAVINLAVALAEAGRRVTIVEADLRKPMVTRYLGMVGGTGLTNVLAGTAGLEDVLQVHGEGAIQVLAAGPTPPNPGELLASESMRALVDKLRAQNDFVLIDSPPLLPVSDASGLAVITDGVLLSVRHGGTTREELAHAATTLSQVGAKTLGVILNIVPPKAELASVYGGGYRYRSEEGRGAHHA